MANVSAIRSNEPTTNPTAVKVDMKHITANRGMLHLLQQGETVHFVSAAAVDFQVD